MSATQRPEMTVSLSLTENAAGQVRQFMEAEKISHESGGLRVSVTPGGCSGFKYSLELADTAMEDDIVVNQHGLRLFVDPFSGQYLQGTTIDYVSTMQASGFTFSNPNATGGCGCGESFSA